MRNWLLLRHGGGAGRSFGSAVYVEKEAWAAAGAPEVMGRLLAESTASDELARDLARRLGWSEKRVRGILVAKRQPTNREQRMGKFGEVLHAGVLEVFQGMAIVTKRHRYNPTPNVPVHGVDLIALAGAGGSGKEEGERIVYAETKLRTVRDAGALIEAYEGLVKISNEVIPTSIAAEMERLYKGDRRMSERLASAAKRQKDARYRIGAVFEKSAWSDSHLDALDRRHDPSRIDMTVDIVKIESLCRLVHESYRRVG